MTILEIVHDVSRRLTSIGLPHAIGGSLASSVWGEYRSTNDADIGVRLLAHQADALIDAFPDPYLLSRNEIAEGLASRDAYRTVQLLHMDEAFKIDLFLLTDDSYTESELERRRTVEVLPGINLPFLAAENIAIQKLRWFRAGNEVSDRQWNDIVRLLDIQLPALDIEYISHWCGHFAVDDLLDRALSQVRR